VRPRRLPKPSPRQPPPWAPRLCVRCGRLRETGETPCARCGATPIPLWWRPRAELLPFGRAAKVRQAIARVTCVIVAIAALPFALLLGPRVLGRVLFAILWPRVRTWEVSSRDGRAVAQVDVIGEQWIRGRGAVHEPGALLAARGTPAAAEVDAAVAERLGLHAEDAVVLAALARLVETGAIVIARDRGRGWRRDGVPPRLAWEPGPSGLVVQRGNGTAAKGSIEAIVLADLERQLARLSEGAAVTPMPSVRAAGSQPEPPPRVPLCLSARLVPALADRRRRASAPATPAHVAAVAAALRAVDPVLRDAAVALAAPLRRALLPLALLDSGRWRPLSTRASTSAPATRPPPSSTASASP
jgi:hypothetical protein